MSKSVLLCVDACKHDKFVVAIGKGNLGNNGVSMIARKVCLFCGKTLDEIELNEKLASAERQLQAAAIETANREVDIEPRDLAYLSSKPFDEMMRDCRQRVDTMKKKAADEARRRWEKEAGECTGN